MSGLVRDSADQGPATALEWRHGQLLFLLSHELRSTLATYPADYLVVGLFPIASVTYDSQALLLGPETGVQIPVWHRTLDFSKFCFISEKEAYFVKIK